MNEDIDFDDEKIKSVRKSSSRRRRELIEDDNLDSVLDSAIATSRSINLRQSTSRTRDNEDSNGPSVGASNRRSSKALTGWGEDGESTRPIRRDFDAKPANETNSDQVVKNGVSRRVIQRENEEIEIPEIPDLEEQTEQVEDMAFKVAEAPDVQVHQISTYKELDREFFKEKAFQFLEGNIDVSLLHCGLSTEQQIAEEEDVIWEWNKLFTEIVSTLSVSKEIEFTVDSEHDLLKDKENDVI